MRSRITRKRLVGAALAASLAASAPVLAADPASFRPVGAINIPDGGVAEIVAATPDGRTLVYTDAGGTAGIVDISLPGNPAVVERIPLPGSPTSVAVTPDGARAIVALQTSVLEVGAPPSSRRDAWS